MRLTTLLLLLLVTASLAVAQPSKDLTTLANWMTGKFSSQEQAKRDTNFFDIRLSVVRIWENRKDGIWLYVEQAAAETLNKPYRQRVYHLKENNVELQSVIYSLPKPLRFAGKPDLVQKLPFDSLSSRIGCEVLITRKDKNTFTGSTKDKECTSELRGATYATTEVTITKNEMLSWDRGYDQSGKQVWGAVTGGYRFIKEK